MSKMPKVLLTGVLLGVALVALFAVIVPAMHTVQCEAVNESAGLRAVYAMYDFNDLEQLDRQMAVLKEQCTDAVFNQLTIDKEERSMSTYLKFKGSPTYVTILDSSDTYVKYSLSNENIAKDRVFLFTFKVDGSGKICDVWEAECIAF